LLFEPDQIVTLKTDDFLNVASFEVRLDLGCNKLSSLDEALVDRSDRFENEVQVMGAKDQRVAFLECRLE